VKNGVFDPPANMTPPAGTLYRIMPSSVYGTYTEDLSDFNRPGSQTSSIRVDNTYYNYRENGYGEDAYFCVLTQDGIASPGTLLDNEASQAIGYFQDAFVVTNTPKPFNANPNADFYWHASSPATVDQTHSETSTVSLSFSLGIDMNMDGGSVSTSITWTAETSVTSEISDWGIDEDTVPSTSVTSWSFHQQYPYDPYTLKWSNFPTWWQSAYSGNNVQTPPALSVNTLQLHTISAWYASGFLRKNNSLPLYIYTDTFYESAIVAADGYFDNHHTAVYYQNPQDFAAFYLDLNSYPKSVARV